MITPGEMRALVADLAEALSARPSAVVAKELRRQKVFRWVVRRFPDHLAHQAMMLMLSDNPTEAQQWFDRLDTLMTAEGWDDEPR